MSEEIEPAATFLGLSVETFTAQYLAQHPTAHGTAFAPRQKPRSPECIFFLNGRCQIHPVKPYECRKVFGCEAGRRHTRIRELVARRWR